MRVPRGSVLSWNRRAEVAWEVVRALVLSSRVLCQCVLSIFTFCIGISTVLLPSTAAGGYRGGTRKGLDLTIAGPIPSKLQSSHHRFSKVASSYAQFNGNQTRSSSPVLHYSSTRSYAFTALITSQNSSIRYVVVTLWLYNHTAQLPHKRRPLARYPYDRVVPRTQLPSTSHLAPASIHPILGLLTHLQILGLSTLLFRPSSFAHR